MLGIIIAVILIIATVTICIVLNKKFEDDYNNKCADWVAKKASYERRYGSDSLFDDAKPEKPKRLIFPVYIAISLSIVIFFASCVTIVPTGYTGILTTFGKVENRTVSSGLNIIAPWQKVVKMDNRTQKAQIEMTSFSSDIQQVDLIVSVNYSINQDVARDLYRTVGVNYYERIVFPRIQENVKVVISQYTAETLIAKRDILSGQIFDALSEDMQNYGIAIVSVTIEDVDFTDEFTTAVEAKAVAAQNKLTAETEQARLTMEAEQAAARAIIASNAQAEQDVIAANAELEVTKIQAEASLYAGEREAEMNKRIAESLTSGLIDYYWIRQWNGELPSTVLGGDAEYMIDLTGDE